MLAMIQQIIKVTSLGQGCRQWVQQRTMQIHDNLGETSIFPPKSSLNFGHHLGFMIYNKQWKHS